MSAVNVHYLDGQDFHLTVYHPSLNATQIKHVQSLERKSTEITTNSWLSAFVGVGFALTSITQAHQSSLIMSIASIVMIVGGTLMYFLETQFLYRQRFIHAANRFGLVHDEMAVSITVSPKDKRLQRQLFEMVVAVRDKPENKSDAASLYYAVLEHRDGDSSLSTRPIGIIMDAL